MSKFCARHILSCLGTMSLRHQDGQLLIRAKPPSWWINTWLFFSLLVISRNIRDCTYHMNCSLYRKSDTVLQFQCSKNSRFVRNITIPNINVIILREQWYKGNWWIFTKSRIFFALTKTVPNIWGIWDLHMWWPFSNKISHTW